MKPVKDKVNAIEVNMQAQSAETKQMKDMMSQLIEQNSKLMQLMEHKWVIGWDHNASKLLSLTVSNIDALLFYLLLLILPIRNTKNGLLVEEMEWDELRMWSNGGLWNKNRNMVSTPFFATALIN